MKPLKVMLATSGPISATRFMREIEANKSLSLAGHANTLSRAYILAESTEPDIVLVGPEIKLQPDFEGLLSLFRVLGISWLEINPVKQKNGLEDQSKTEKNQNKISTGMPSDEFFDLLQKTHLSQNKPGKTTLKKNNFSPNPTIQTTFSADRIILIGASTGGIDALLTILSEFPENCPPTAIVQHTGTAFSESLIRLFARCCAAKVVAAQPGINLVPGTIVIGAGCVGHLRLSKSLPYHTELVQGPPVSGHTPSIDMLFSSAVPFAHNVTAALLTGMGRDGAKGLLDLRHAGATTIAQDEESSVVWGMPKAAVQLGAAMSTAPLSEMAKLLLKKSQKKSISAVK